MYSTETEEALKKLGIMTKDNKGNDRNIWDILDDIAIAWKQSTPPWYKRLWIKIKSLF